MFCERSAIMKLVWYARYLNWDKSWEQLANRHWREADVPFGGISIFVPSFLHTRLEWILARPGQTPQITRHRLINNN